MSLSVLYDLMYPVSVLTNVLSILDTFNTGVTLPFVFNVYHVKLLHFFVFGEV